MTQLWALGAAALGAGYSAGDFSPSDVLEAVLDRLGRVDPLLHAFVDVDGEGARAAARASGRRWAAGTPLSPLDGVPISIKDNLHLAGRPTTWGSWALGDFRAAADEVPVGRLRAAGAVLFGKTNVPEFAMRGVTLNDRFGTTRNPWDLARTPGGSSGGAAAAVAAGLGPLALVTDGGGSTRRPASHCGLVGLKPSAGLVARGGGLPEIFGDHEVVGAIGRDIADVIHLIEAVSGASLRRPASPARILFVPTFADAPVDPAIARAVRRAAERFAALGHEVEEAGRFDLAEAVNARWSTLSDTGLADLFADLAAHPEWADPVAATTAEGRLGAPARASLERGRAAGAADRAALDTAIAAARRDLGGLFSRHDAVLTPATAALPWAADLDHPPEIAGRAVGPRGHAVFTALANAAGLPGLALPTEVVEGLPTGIQLLGPVGSDGALLALGSAFSAAHPFTARCPLGADGGSRSHAEAEDGLRRTTRDPDPRAP